jgi:hypothetical protein
VDCNVGKGYFPGMGKRPRNADVGLANANAVRSARSRKEDARITLALVSAAAFGHAKRLKQFVALFERDGVPTRRTGGKWTDKLVAHEFARLGRKPSSFREEMGRPSPFERRSYSEEAFWAWKAASDRHHELCDRNGSWRPGNEVIPQRNSPVRHPDHGSDEFNEGMFNGLVAGSFLCTFNRPVTGLTYQIKLAAFECEVFVWKLSRAERAAIDDNIRDRFLIPENMVPADTITAKQMAARNRGVRLKE